MCCAVVLLLLDELAMVAVEESLLGLLLKLMLLYAWPLLAFSVVFFSPSEVGLDVLVAMFY